MPGHRGASDRAPQNHAQQLPHEGEKDKAEQKDD
jgi:hypothetical protein